MQTMIFYQLWIKKSIQHNKCNDDVGIPMPYETLQLDAIDNDEEYDPQADEYYNDITHCWMKIR